MILGFNSNALETGNKQPKSDLSSLFILSYFAIKFMHTNFMVNSLHPINMKFADPFENDKPSKTKYYTFSFTFGYVYSNNQAP